MKPTSFLSIVLLIAFASCQRSSVDADKLNEQITTLESELSSIKEDHQILENNKEVVKRFYQEFFGDLNFEVANEYIGDVYIQHNPAVADGRQALIDAAKVWFQNAPKRTINIHNVIAENDLVFIHIISADSEGTKSSTMDVFRVTDGKLSEHWDAFATFRKEDNSANDNPLF